MTTTEWTVPDLLQMSGGYWSTCALHAGVKLDVFSLLDGVARSADEVAHLANTDRRATGMLLDALSALGLLEKQGTSYRDVEFAANRLSKASPEYLGHILMHHHHLMQGWSRLHEAVTTGAPIRNRIAHEDDATVRESFLMGMFNLASLQAPRIAKTLKLTGCRRLLDLGGGPATYAIHFCQVNPELTSVVFDLPTTRTFAESTIDRFKLADRITFESGDYHTDSLPAGFDAAWLSHILHAEGPAVCRDLLGKAVAALEPGGTLMVQEFILNDAGSGPLFPALFSLNMLLGTEAGQAYPERELTAMMQEAGLSAVSRLNLDLPNGAGVIIGRKQ